MLDELPPPLAERAHTLGRAAAEDALPRLAELAFDTYRCGARLPDDLRDLPGELASAFRRIAREATAEILRATWPERRREEFAADVLVEVLDTGAAKLVVSPLFVAGRYQKLARGISQTVFHCPVCHGGRRRAECTACNGAGRLVPESVEEFVCAPLREAVDGRSARFHGSGREDVDVRMLGDGRPFAVTVELPRLRTFDAAAVAARVEAASEGRVLVRDLRRVDRRERAGITNEHGVKTYRVVVRRDDGGALTADAAERVLALAGAELSQRTPRRVAVRRADLVRTRRILSVSGALEGEDLVLAVGTEPGTYVKEFVSGDDGRTTPSVASVLGLPVTCVELDVLAVGDGVAGTVGAVDGADAAASPVRPPTS